MPIVFGFAEHRRRLLDEEAQRLRLRRRRTARCEPGSSESTGEGLATPGDRAGLVIVSQDTDEPFQRRGDFWESHLRPRVGTRYLVYTPDEADEFADADPLLLQATMRGEVLVG